MIYSDSITFLRECVIYNLPAVFQDGPAVTEGPYTACSSRDWAHPNHIRVVHRVGRNFEAFSLSCGEGAAPPDRLALDQHYLVSAGSVRGQAAVWDLSQRRQTAVLEHSATDAIEVACHGGEVVTASLRNVKWWDAASGAMKKEIMLGIDEKQFAARAVDFHYPLVGLGSNDRSGSYSVRIIDLAIGRCFRQFEGNGQLLTFSLGSSQFSVCTIHSSDPHQTSRLITYDFSTVRRATDDAKKPAAAAAAASGAGPF